MRGFNYLFSNADWFSIQEHQKKALVDEITQFDGNRLLNTSIDDLCEYFEKKYCVDIPILIEDRIIADQKESQIDVSRDPMRHIRDRSRPFFIAGAKVEITIPFYGDAEAFKIRPTSYTSNPPMAQIRGEALVLEIEGADLKTEEVKAYIHRTLSEIKSQLAILHKDAEILNTQLPQLARAEIERRRVKLLENQSLVASLGFPLKERADAPKTFVTLEVRRKLAPTLPATSTSPYKPEPTLPLDDYDHILSVIQNMARVMELSPSAFATMDEESLRSHFLVQLNGHYEGGATRETFNYEGKTDILIRIQGKNIFVAECKYWGGPRKLTDTIDQLLSYSSWRDTKTSIIIFNRNKNFSAVLDSIGPTVNAHPNCKKFIGREQETNFRYTFAHRDDPNREMILTVLAFDVPLKRK
jgi:hypothetical protein